jgi:hypothetical protein
MKTIKNFKSIKKLKTTQKASIKQNIDDKKGDDEYYRIVKCLLKMVF